ncbi:MAG: TRAP transporter substrate-binding protein [Ferrovibrionaceae bacterium]
MPKLLAAILLAFLVGVGLGAIVQQPRREPVAAVAPVVAPPTKLVIASAFPTQTPLLGERLVAFADKVERLTGGRVDVDLEEPGESVQPRDLLAAVAQGKIQSAWVAPSLFADQNSAFTLFGAVPFGPSGVEFVAWLFRGGGFDLMRALFADSHVAAVPCGITPPRAGGWFRSEINKPADLKGLRMRSYGTAAKVLEKVGVDVVRLPSGQAFHQLQQGNIDAVEMSYPVLDLDMGFQKLVKHYYFPGWQQPAGLLVLIVNQQLWNDFTPERRAEIETACGDSIADSLAQGNISQAEALNQLKEKGVEIHRWPGSVLVALNQGWEQIVVEETAKNPAFKQIWDSLNEFRNRYRNWRDLSVMR